MYSEQRIFKLEEDRKRLREGLRAFAERYRCTCKHNRCKRCMLSKMADEILKDTEDHP